MSSIKPISHATQAQSQFSPGLYIVATPIGNLGDITIRALQALQAADRILAEDTRHTSKLLAAYDIEAKLTSYHDHNVAKMLPKVIKWLQDDEIIVQVSDAGTPLISDPGFKLVREVLDQGFPVIPLPGASAPIAALMSAGLPSNRFLFGGFLPSKSKARQKELTELKQVMATLIFFESPNRIEDCLKDMLLVFGDRSAVLAREITKKYEEFRRGRLSDILSGVSSHPPKGEIVILLGPPESECRWDGDQVDVALRNILPKLGAKKASVEIAEISGWSKRDIYQRALTLK